MKKFKVIIDGYSPNPKRSRCFQKRFRAESEKDAEILAEGHIEKLAEKHTEISEWNIAGVERMD